MKIHEYKPTKYIRVAMGKIGHKEEYIGIDEATMEEVEDMIKMVIESQNLSPFEKGHRTMISMREYVGATAGKSKSISFRGLPVSVTKELIINHINNLNNKHETY